MFTNPTLAAGLPGAAVHPGLGAARSGPAKWRRRLRGRLAGGAVALVSAGAGAVPWPACHGDYQPLTVASQMPYALVSVAGRQGHMVLDFGASRSSITPHNFQGEVKPAPTVPAGDRYADFVFFGRWGEVQLLPNQPSLAPLVTTDGQASLAQAGVIGTDFLAQHVYTLDYRGGHLWRAERGRFCSDAALRAAGWRALSTAGYFASDGRSLSCPLANAPPGGCVNIPTVPLRIGGVATMAQLDTGYDDGRRPYAVNINAALFDALRGANVRLRPLPDVALQLSTCVAGVSERVEAYELAAGTPFGFVDEDGRLQRPAGATPITLFVKRPPVQAMACGGIGTWAQPAAQLGASFFARAALVVDPFSARVWVR
jgi:hypothetical protein